MKTLSYFLRNRLYEDPERAGRQVDFEQRMADPSRYTIGHNIHPAADNPDQEGADTTDDPTAAPYDGAQVSNGDQAAGGQPGSPPEQGLQNIQPGSPDQQHMESTNVNEFENNLVDMFLEELLGEGEPSELTERGPYDTQDLNRQELSRLGGGTPTQRPAVDYYDRTGVAAGQPGSPQNFGSPQTAGVADQRAALSPATNPVPVGGGRPATPTSGHVAPSAIPAAGGYKPAPETGNLAQGMSGKRVSDMQDYLNKYNGTNNVGAGGEYGSGQGQKSGLAVDGKFGPDTAKAYQSFQNQTRQQGGVNSARSGNGSTQIPSAATPAPVGGVNSARSGNGPTQIPSAAPSPQANFGDPFGGSQYIPKGTPAVKPAPVSGVNSVRSGNGPTQIPSAATPTASTPTPVAQSANGGVNTTQIPSGTNESKNWKSLRMMSWNDYNILHEADKRTEKKVRGY